MRRVRFSHPALGLLGCRPIGRTGDFGSSDARSSRAARMASLHLRKEESGRKKSGRSGMVQLAGRRSLKPCGEGSSPSPGIVFHCRPMAGQPAVNRPVGGSIPSGGALVPVRQWLVCRSLNPAMVGSIPPGDVGAMRKGRRCSKEVPISRVRNARWGETPTSSARRRGAGRGPFKQYVPLIQRPGCRSFNPTGRVRLPYGTCLCGV